MGRGIEEVKVDEVIDAQGLEEQDHIAQVHTLDLRDGVFLQLVLISPRRVQPDIEPSAVTSCTGYADTT